MKRRPNPRDRRGFALIVIVLVVAMMSVVAATLLSSIGSELSIIGRRRETWAARQIADSGAREMLANNGALLPDFNTANLETTWQPSANSPAVDSASGSGYTGKYRLLRFVPVSESSEGSVRALVYEIDSTGQYLANDSTSEVAGEVYRTVAVAQGIVAPRIHAR
jgi:type II secretory pathway pseudopilin PulG